MIAPRSENESAFDFSKRIVYGKLVDKTLADEDYSELAEVLYGQSYSTDVARRMMYGSCKTLQLIDGERFESVSDSKLLDEIDIKQRELEKERQRFYDQRREDKKLVTEMARMEHIRDAIVDSANRLNDTVGTLYTDYKPSYDADNEAVLVLCDWHYGMTTDNVWNTYNTDICRSRVRHVTYETIDRLKKNNCHRLHVVVLGDLIHGACHVSARVASEELVCDQLMQATEVLAQTIIALSAYVDETCVYVTYGNHARTVPNKKDNIHHDNLERIIPWWLSCRFTDREDIHVSEGENEFLYFDVCGYGICATHGDLDSVRGSTKTLSTLFHKRYGRDIDYILLADKHHRDEFEELGVCAMISGSLCGTDDYANDRRLYSNPEQLLLIMNHDCGVDATYHIRCK